jgi:hypothetical protein
MPYPHAGGRNRYPPTPFGQRTWPDIDLHIAPILLGEGIRRVRRRCPKGHQHVDEQRREVGIGVAVPGRWPSS